METVQDVTQKTGFEFSWDIEDEKAAAEVRAKMWKQRTGLNEESLKGAIEALIFMSERPIQIQTIKKSIDEDLPLRVIHESITALQEEYEKAGHGIRLLEVAGGFQFRTKIQFSNYVANIHKAPVISLSPLALEVLAIIAFKQPVTKMDVDTMRGVDSGHLIRGLMDKGLVKVVGRSDDAGKFSTFGTTHQFLELFSVNELEDLPTMNELVEMAEKNSVGEIEDIKEIVKTSSESFHFDEIDELDELSNDIKNINSHTEFTQLLKSNTAKPEGDEEAKSAFDLLEEFVEAKEVVENQFFDESDDFDLEEEIEAAQEELPSEADLLEEELDAAFDNLQKRSEAIETEEVVAQDEDNDEWEDVESSYTESFKEKIDEDEDFEVADLASIKENLKDLS